MARIFVSYRRADSQTVTERIHDRLVKSFGHENVFLDVDNNIPAGSEWKDVLRQKLYESDILLVIIGSKWLQIMQSRMKEDEDYVRFEIQTGLERGTIMKVVPVLVNDVSASVISDLPENISDLSNKQIKRVRGNPDFHRDMDQLIKELKGSQSLFGFLPDWKQVVSLLVITVIAASILYSIATSTPSSIEFFVVDQQETLGTTTSETTLPVDNSSGDEYLYSDLQIVKDFQHTITITFTPEGQQLNREEVERRLLNTYDLPDFSGQKQCLIPADVPPGEVYQYEVEWTEIIRSGYISEISVGETGSIFGTYDILVDFQCQTVGVINQE